MSAFAIEALKLRRAGVTRVATAILVVLCPLAVTGFVLLGRGAPDTPLALKMLALAPADGWPGFLTLLGQVLTVAVLLAGGLAMCWTFGREFVDGTIHGLFATAVPRRTIAAAKIATILVWLGTAILAAVAVAFVAGLLIDLGPPASWRELVRAAGRAIAAAGLSALLTTPLAWVASILRGYLPAIGALLALVVLTEVVTALGAGAWFPYAAPGLWLGMGGQAAAAHVTIAQLGLTVPVATLGAVSTLVWWQRAEVV